MSVNKPAGFARKLQKYKDNIPKQENAIKKALAQEIVNQVVGDTPVDTGRARDAWIVSVGSPDRTTIPAGAYGPSTHRGQRATGGPTRSGLGSIGKAKARIASVRPKQAIYLNNNLPYIARLNDGYSRQAPANFFAIAIERARGIVRRQLVRYRIFTDG